MISFLISNLCTDGPHNENTMETYIGLNADQFRLVASIVIPSLLSSFKNLDKSQMALYIYLMKLRTGHTYAQIAPFFNLSTRKISSWIRIVRNKVHSKFVPLYLYNQNRDNLLENTSPLSRKLYRVDDEFVVVAWDATYVYTIKSSNYAFQKQSYSGQMTRNLVKFMLCVTTNGLIVAAYGPFDATKNDAKILDEILHDGESIFSILRPGDVIVVDRGFRDSINDLKRRGFIIKTPKGTRANQLSRRDANESRFATKTRFVVEVRNTHIKNKWKHLSGTKNYQSIPHLKKDFQICAAFVNAFCRSIISDQNDWDGIGDLMLENFSERNTLRAIAHLIPHNAFQTVTNLTLFPKFTYRELKIISQESYQIRQAVSYCQLHMKVNNNNFTINIWQGNGCQILCGNLLKNGTSNPLLLSVNLRSRFQSNKIHKVYILLSSDLDENFVVSAFCCSCRHGCRTVGCCSHVMAVIWYSLYVDHNKMKSLFPSSNLDNVFENWQNEYSESSSDLEFNSDSSDSLPSDIDSN